MFCLTRVDGLLSSQRSGRVLQIRRSGCLLQTRQSWRAYEVGLTSVLGVFTYLSTLKRVRGRSVSPNWCDRKDCESRFSDLGLRVSGFGFWASGFGFRVSGFGFWVSDFESRFSDFGFSGSGQNLKADKAYRNSSAKKIFLCKHDHSSIYFGLSVANR